MQLTLLALAAVANAFPFMSPDVSETDRQSMLESHIAQASKNVARFPKTHSARALTGLIGGGALGGDSPTLLYQRHSQGLVQVPDSAHPFIAPGSTDVRGMCPTLNTLANYGYINRNGITTLAQASDAVQQVFGFGYDVATFLSGLGLIAGGDLLTGIFSIGGADSRVPNTLGPALGISKHGFFEIDGSISREDNYFGNQANFIPSRWEAIRKQAETYGSGFYGRETWIANQEATYSLSRSSNPQADLGVKYFAVSLAERAFMYRGLPNGTTVDTADAANIEPWFLDNKIPENWFRRDTLYDLDGLGVDIVDLYSGYPFELGQNDGDNNFIPLDMDLSNKTPADIMCLILTNIFDETPGQLAPTVANNLDLYFDFVNGVIAPFFQDSFNCPAVSTFSTPGCDCKTCNDPALSANMPGADGAITGTPGPGQPLTNQ